jgi:hypothetical protein
MLNSKMRPGDQRIGLQHRTTPFAVFGRLDEGQFICGTISPDPATRKTRRSFDGGQRHLAGNSTNFGGHDHCHGEAL